MQRNNRIQRQDCQIEKQNVESENRQSSVDSYTTIKSSTALTDEAGHSSNSGSSSKISNNSSCMIGSGCAAQVGERGGSATTSSSGGCNHGSGGGSSRGATTGASSSTGSQGSSEIEAKERRFGSINMHPLPETAVQSDCFHGNFRYKIQRFGSVADKTLQMRLPIQSALEERRRNKTNENSNLSAVDKALDINATDAEKRGSNADRNINNAANLGRTARRCANISSVNVVSTGNGKVSRIGDYILGKTIGKGNFAVVKLATHNVLRCKMAVKIMNKTLIGLNNLEKVTREIEAMKRVEHPHIIKLYQVLETDTKIFMVMEYAEKGEVFDHISHAHAFTEKDARELFWQVICAIHYCHKSSVVHRDLKAENLLLNANYQIKVADFGFSNFFESLKLLSTHCGSPQYAAPELFRGDLYDGPLADVWSLGVVLYIMVCGSFPFPGESLGDIRNQVLRGLVRFPFFLSTSCEYLVRGMLQVDPARRFRIDQIISTPWMQASSNVEKYKTVMDYYEKKAIETKFEEIFHRQHPEHSDIIREQSYHSSKVKIDSALLMALQMAGYDEDEVKISVINKTYDKSYAAYHLLKDKVCRFFNNPILKLYMDAAHASILEVASTTAAAAAAAAASAGRDTSDERVIDGDRSTNKDMDELMTSLHEQNQKMTIDQRTLSGSGDGKTGEYSKKYGSGYMDVANYNSRRNSLSYVRGKLISTGGPAGIDVVATTARLYYWVLEADEDYIISASGHYNLADNTTVNSQVNVRRHTVQLTEIPNELKTISNLANINPGFPKTEQKEVLNKENKENLSKMGHVFRMKQMSLDSTQSQNSSKLNQQHNTKLMHNTYLPGMVVVGASEGQRYTQQQNPYQHSNFQATMSSVSSQLPEIAEVPTMDSEFLEVDETVADTTATVAKDLQVDTDVTMVGSGQYREPQSQVYQQQQQQVMGSNDSVTGSSSKLLHNLPQLNLPANLPALQNQPMAKFTIKDPHLLAPPDFMTPYNSCFPRRSSDGAADKQPLHRSNPGVGGSYPEHTAYKYRSSQNESLYDAVVKQVVPRTTKDNLVGGDEISPLEFMGLHLKRFSLPINGSYNLHNTNVCGDGNPAVVMGDNTNTIGSGIYPGLDYPDCLSYYSSDWQTCGFRRGSEDSQMSLWHRRVARSGYIDSRSEFLASAPPSRGSSPYSKHSSTLISGGSVVSGSGGAGATAGGSSGGSIGRRKSGRYRSNDRLCTGAVASSSGHIGSSVGDTIQQPDIQSITTVTEDNNATARSLGSSNSTANIKSQPVLDLQELKAELQNLIPTTISAEKSNKACSSTSINSAAMIIPSISLSPIATEDTQLDPMSNYMSDFNSKADNTYSFIRTSVESKDCSQPIYSNSSDFNVSTGQNEQKISSSYQPYMSSEDISPYQRQMYFRWFPGFIRSATVADSLPQTNIGSESGAQQGQPLTSQFYPSQHSSHSYCNQQQEYNAMNTNSDITTQSSNSLPDKRNDDYKNSGNNFSNINLMFHQHEPPPLPYYSPFIRDEDAADLAAIERVNRKISTSVAVTTTGPSIIQSPLPGQRKDVSAMRNPTSEKCLESSTATSQYIIPVQTNVQPLQPPALVPFLQESQSALELSNSAVATATAAVVSASNTPTATAPVLTLTSSAKQRRFNLLRGFSAEENSSYSFDYLSQLSVGSSDVRANSNSNAAVLATTTVVATSDSMECEERVPEDSSEGLSTIEEQMESS